VPTGGETWRSTEACRRLRVDYGLTGSYSGFEVPSWVAAVRPNIFIWMPVRVTGN
jgi:hypothetical protein